MTIVNKNHRFPSKKKKKKRKVDCRLFWFVNGKILTRYIYIYIYIYMGNVNTTGSELIHFPLFFQLFFLLHTPPINLEIEEVASWIKVLLNQEQVHNPNRQLALPGSILESLLNLKTQQDNSRRLQISRSRAAEWQSKRCSHLRPQVKKRSSNFN